MDFTFIEELVKDLYSLAGRPSIPPVVLFKLIFINIIFGINSMRRTCEECKVNIAYRWFLGLSIYDEIPKKGGIISEYPLTTAPNPRLFPMRNRIISALSDYVIVVEARQKSGSLITADYAMEQGKEVYVVPGRITDPLSFGCNKLIHQGAGIITNVSDFLEEMQILDKKVSAQINFRKNSLEKDEMLVYSLLDFCPIGLGTLMDRLPFKLIDLLDIMERLEDKGFIKETVPNYYIKTL